MFSRHLDFLFKYLISKYSHILSPRVRGSTYEFGEGHSLAHHRDGTGEGRNHVGFSYQAFVHLSAFICCLTPTPPPPTIS